MKKKKKRPHIQPVDDYTLISLRNFIPTAMVWLSSPKKSPNHDLTSHLPTCFKKPMPKASPNRLEPSNNPSPSNDQKEPQILLI